MNQRGLRPFEAQMDGRVPGKDMMRYRLKRPFFIRYDPIYKKKLKVKKLLLYSTKNATFVPILAMN